MGLDGVDDFKRGPTDGHDAAEAVGDEDICPSPSKQGLISRDGLVLLGKGLEGRVVDGRENITLSGSLKIT